MNDPIIEEIKDMLDARSKLGIKKYGTTLAGNKKADSDPTYWLRMALEECLDQAGYLMCEIKRVEKISKVRDD